MQITLGLSKPEVDVGGIQHVSRMREERIQDFSSPLQQHQCHSGSPGIVLDDAGKLSFLDSCSDTKFRYRCLM